MRELLFVFLGGGFGSCIRFITSLLWRHMSLHPRYEAMLFPWPTFIVNILGCLLIGFFYQYSQQWNLSPETRLMLTTGFCGGFTTFSTFSYEGVALLQGGHYSTYAIYVTLSILLGLGAAFVPTLIHNFCS